jgi:hypothetical protein
MKLAKTIFALAALGSAIGLEAYAGQRRHDKNAIRLSPDVAYCQRTGAKDFAIVDKQFPNDPLFKMHGAFDGTVIFGLAQGEHGNARHMTYELGADHCTLDLAPGISAIYKLKPAP